MNEIVGQFKGLVSIWFREWVEDLDSKYKEGKLHTTKYTFSGVK